MSNASTPLRITVGKNYVCRNGRVVRCRETVASTEVKYRHIFEDRFENPSECFFSTTKDGEVFGHDDPSPYDLIREAPAPFQTKTKT